MFSKFKTELLIGSLLLSTVALIFANQVVERSYELTPSKLGELQAAADVESNGGSSAFVEVKDGAFRLNYSVDSDSFANAYSTMSIYPDDTFDRDLSWVDRIEIKLKSSRSQSDEILFQVRNFEPDTTVTQEKVSFKYNEVLLPVTDTMQTISVRRNEFTVPTWWKQKYDVCGEEANIAFDDVEFFEININRGTEEGVIDVASIRCVGNWANAAALNQLLLWLWMGGALVGLIVRMLRLKKKLNEKTESSTNLETQNNLLIAESAIFQDLARRDPLTGLFNRYGVEEELGDGPSKHRVDYAMILFDLDEFKEINDNLGHCYGDRVLFDIARIAQSAINEKDLAARWGGDEFLLILKDREVEAAVEIAEGIRHSISASDLNYSCSFGVSKSQVGKGFEAILRDADTALYDSKSSGRNTIRIYKNQDIDRRRNEPDRRTSGGENVPAQDVIQDDIPSITLPQVETPTGGFMIYD